MFQLSASPCHIQEVSKQNKYRLHSPDNTLVHISYFNCFNPQLALEDIQQHSKIVSFLRNKFNQDIILITEGVKTTKPGLSMDIALIPGSVSTSSNIMVDDDSSDNRQ